MGDGANQTAARSRDGSGALRLGAFLTLFGILAGHALLETARDALFLANIPAERLPWVYLVIAAVALGIARLSNRSAGIARQRTRLILLLLVGSLVTFAFWWFAGTAGQWVFYSLYVWSGVISSLIVVSFWLVLGELFTITQGKRLYASIATGGSIGALAGFGLSTAMTLRVGADSLLLLSAGFFALSALGPALLPRLPGAVSSADAGAAVVARTRAAARGRVPGFAHTISEIVSHAYARRVAMLVVLSTLTLTFADFLFKSVVAEEIPKEQLGTWFGGIYLALNVGSLLLLVLGVTPLVRRLSIHRSLAVLPGLMALAAVGVLVGGALVPILLLKSADGTLRYSLHKTAQELLYLPMPSELRGSVKSFIDIVGQNGARAIASIGILLVVGLPGHDVLIAGGVLALALGWVWAALEIRGAYLDVFRQTLSEGAIETRIDYPDLDLASLETLIRALNHSDSQHVIAALSLLAERGRVDLIPVLILYHPSHEVVARALDLFATSRRGDFVMVLERLVDHENAGVRAATVRAMWAVDPQREPLQELATSECPCIRMSAVAGLVAHGWIDPAEAAQELERAVHDEAPYTRLAVANASKLRYVAAYREPLQRLSRDPDVEVRLEAVRAIRASGDPHFTAHLVALLDDRVIREEVRLALIERGEPALRVLSRMLADEGAPLSVRRHVPRTISRFATPPAIEILLQSLRRPLPGMVRYKVLRGLAPLLKGPVASVVDLTPVARELETTVERALQLLHWKIELDRARSRNSGRSTTGGALLGELLRDKERLAIERIFQLLQFLYPDEDFRGILAGVDSEQRASRASSIELIENLLSPELSRALLALVGSGSEVSRWRRAGRARGTRALTCAELLREMIEDGSASVRAFAFYHLSELDLHLTIPPDPALGTEPVSGLGRMRERALGLIERLPDAALRRPALRHPTGEAAHG